MLLLRLAAGRGDWAGKLNGVGGHVERGEEPRASAIREVAEETGLTPGPSFRLCGVVLIDTQQSTIVPLALKAYRGQAPFTAAYRYDENGELTIDVGHRSSA
jgi:8-oxo-dGTP pyrophosphatase MutT (NUDIX family)